MALRNIKGLWKARLRRLASRINSMTALLLAAALMAMGNMLAYRFFARIEISSSGNVLSVKTREIIKGLNEDVRVISFFQTGHELNDEISAILRSYEYEALRYFPVRLRVEFVDPDRDLSRIRDLSGKYDLKSPNNLLLESGGRVRYLDINDLASYELAFRDGKPERRMTGLIAEEAISSAIQSVASGQRPVVYCTFGHGEHDPSDFSKQRGYSGIARAMIRDNIELKTLLPASAGQIPGDCSLLLVAGPEKMFSISERDMIARYLETGGRLLALVNPFVPNGLEDLLAAWRVALDDDYVVGPSYSGNELLVTDYGNHPVTRGMQNYLTVFYSPRSVECAGGESWGGGFQRADKPRTLSLAYVNKGWAESDSRQNPPEYNSANDRAAPVSVAVAVERGGVSGIDLNLRATRLVVIGDSYFVANAALSSGLGANSDFFMNAVNWLLERDSMVGIAPRIPEQIRMDKDPLKMRYMMLSALFGLPLLMALAGVFVMSARRRN